MNRYARSDRTPACGGFAGGGRASAAKYADKQNRWADKKDARAAGRACIEARGGVSFR